MSKYAPDPRAADRIDVVAVQLRRLAEPVPHVLDQHAHAIPRRRRQHLADLGDRPVPHVVVRLFRSGHLARHEQDRRSADRVRILDRLDQRQLARVRAPRDSATTAGTRPSSARRRPRRAPARRSRRSPPAVPGMSLMSGLPPFDPVEPQPLVLIQRRDVVRAASCRSRPPCSI